MSGEHALINLIIEEFCLLQKKSKKSWLKGGATPEMGGEACRSIVLS